MKSKHLTERHLLSCLGSDGLSEQLSNLARVEMVDETPDTRLTEAGKLLVEVDEFADIGVWVVVCALLWRSFAKHVGKERGVTFFLLGHELNQGTIFSSKTGSDEIFFREDSKSVVEKIELNPLLVETQGDRLKIEVTFNHVAWQTAIGSKSTC